MSEFDKKGGSLTPEQRALLQAVTSKILNSDLLSKYNRALEALRQDRMEVDPSVKDPEKAAHPLSRLARAVLGDIPLAGAGEALFAVRVDPPDEEELAEVEYDESASDEDRVTALGTMVELVQVEPVEGAVIEGSPVYIGSRMPDGSIVTSRRTPDLFTEKDFVILEEVAKLQDSAGIEIEF